MSKRAKDLNRHQVSYSEPSFDVVLFYVTNIESLAKRFNNSNITLIFRGQIKPFVNAVLELQITSNE